MIDIIAYYWPRFLVGIWFALTNTSISLRGESKKRFLPRFLLLFILSGTMVAIVTEWLTKASFGKFVVPFLVNHDVQVQTGIDTLFRISCDIISYIIPVFVFSKIIKEHWTIAATVYFMYVVVDRLCMVLAISAVTYFLAFILVIMLVGLMIRDNLMYVVENANVTMPTDRISGPRSNANQIFFVDMNAFPPEYS